MVIGRFEFMTSRVQRDSYSDDIDNYQCSHISYKSIYLKNMLYSRLSENQQYGWVFGFNAQKLWE
jgi:hypothetical protein